MKSTTKAILVVLCALVLAAGSLFGTLAYLTDKDADTNTFTVGSVRLKLDEAKVKEDGTYVTDADNRTDENKYHLIPGHAYIKDPTVTVLGGSEESYVRMLATVTYAKDADAVFGTDLTQWIDINEADWQVVGAPVTTKDESAGTITRTYEFRYKETVAKSDADTKLPALFTRIQVPGEITKEQIVHLDEMVISVQAHGIQAAGFDTADDAWTAFEEQK